MPKLREPQKKEEEKPVVTAGQQQEPFEPPAPEVIEPEPAPQPDDNTEELKRQVAALRQSELTARQQAAQAALQRDQAIQYAQERDAAFNRSRQEASDSRLEAITSGMAAAEAEIEEAKKAFRMSVIEQDVDAQVAANERLAEAKANLVNLTNGKAALERAITAEKERLQQVQQQRQQQAQQPQGDQLDRTNLPQTAKNWLRAHPEYLTDPRKNAKIQSLHWDVLDENHEPFSAAYYVSLEEKLGLRSKPRQNVAEEEFEDDNPPPRKAIVSAPVSREAPSSTGNRQPGLVRLTSAQREAAKMAGITEAEYAKQVIELNKQKANGAYGGQP